MSTFQTRSEATGLHYYGTFAEAMAAAKKNETIWKISFMMPDGCNIRLVRRLIVSCERREFEWVYEPIIPIM